jgi:phage terminase small subunit
VQLWEEKKTTKEVMAEEENNIEPLTDKQKKFCYEYCVDLNGTQAAIRAGYSEKTAAAIASQNLIKLNIQAEVKKLQDNLAETAGLTKLRILNEHIKIAFTSIAHLHETWIKRKEFELLTEDQKACIAEIDTKIKTEYEYDPETEKREPIHVEYVRIKLYDKQKALDSISKMLGYEAPIKSVIDLNSQSLPTVIAKRHVVTD